MPELPELEVLGETLDATLGGLSIAGVRLRHTALVKTSTPPVESLAGRIWRRTSRRGRYLLIALDPALILAIHLRPGGRMVVSAPVGSGAKIASTRGAPAKVVSLTLEFHDGHRLQVVELGTRKRSAVYALEPDEVADLVAHVGIEPGDAAFTVDRLAALLAGLANGLKAVLMDQRQMAGIGNTYADEILFRARLSPFRPADTLRQDEVARLHAAIRETLDAGIVAARRRNYLAIAKPEQRDYLQVHGHEEAPCPHCGMAIAAIHYGERSTYYCPTCQSDDRSAIDRRPVRSLRYEVAQD